MSSLEEILIRIKAQDLVSDVTKGIENNAESMSSKISSSVSSMNTAFLNLRITADGFFSSLTGGKSAADVIFGTSSKAETNKVLLNNMTETAAGAEQLYKTVDSVTDNSLTSMQELIPAMNAFKAATGASDAEMNNITSGMANFGAAVLAQTGSTERAQTAMMDLSKGIKGAFASLDQYGVSEDALMRTGLWTGKEDDVEGYMAAVTEVIGSTEELMNTNEGLDAQIGKAFSRAGKKIGNEFLPIIKDVKRGFLDLDNSMGGNLTAGILVAVEGIDMLSQSFYNVSNIIEGANNVKKAWSSVTDVLSDVRDSAKKAMSTLSGLGKSMPEGVDLSKPTNPMNGPQQIAMELDGKEQLDGWNDYFRSIDEEEVMVDKVNTKTESLGKKTDKLGKETQKVNNSKKSTSKMSKLGGLIPKGTGASAAEGAAEAGTASAGLSGLSASISAMIAPILALAAVVAVIIAVVAALVAEALIFARGIAELIKALGFSKLNIKPSIEGIKQIGEAIWELAKVMGAMTIASAISIVSQGFAAFGVGVGTIQQSAANIKKMIPLLNQLGALPTVSPTIAEKLKSISDGVKAIADTVSSMTTISVGVWIGGFVDKITGGSITNLTNAKDSLKKAIPILNEFKDIDGVDESVGTKLKTIGDGLKGASDALSALADISWTEATGWLVGLDDSMESLSTAHDQLKNAADVLSTFGDLPEIPAGAKERLTSTANALKSVKTSIDTLNKIDVNTLDMEDKVEKIQTAKDGLTRIARELRYLGGMPQVPANVKTRLDLVKNGLIGLNSAVKTVGNVSEIPEDAVGKISTNVSRLRGIAVELRYLGGMAQVPANVSTRVNMAKRGVIALNSGVLSLRNLTSVDGNAVNKVHRGVDAVKKVAKELDGLKGTGIGNARSIINTVNNALKSLNNTLRAAKGVRANSTNIGKSIVNGVKAGMASLNSSVMALVNEAMSNFRSASVSGGRTAGTEATNGFKYKFKPSTVVKDEMNYMTQAVKNGSGGFLSAMAQVASDAVQTFKTNMGQASPGHVARSMGQEMVWASEAVQNKSGILIKTVAGTARKVVDAWGNPTLNVGSNGLSKAIKSPNLNVIHDLSNNRGVNGSKKDGDVTIVNVNEGAIPVDARNMTTTEAQQLLILALEGLGIWNNKDIKGV